MILSILGTMSLFADPGIMIDIDIFIERPSGISPPEMGCK